MTISRMSQFAIEELKTQLKDNKKTVTALLKEHEKLDSASYNMPYGTPKRLATDALSSELSKLASALDDHNDAIEIAIYADKDLKKYMAAVEKARKTLAKLEIEPKKTKPALKSVPSPAPYDND